MAEFVIFKDIKCCEGSACDTDDLIENPDELSEADQIEYLFDHMDEIEDWLNNQDYNADYNEDVLDNDLKKILSDY